MLQGQSKRRFSGLIPLRPVNARRWEISSASLCSEEVGAEKSISSSVALLVSEVSEGIDGEWSGRSSPDTEPLTLAELRTAP